MGPFVKRINMTKMEATNSSVRRRSGKKLTVRLGDGFLNNTTNQMIQLLRNTSANEKGKEKNEK